MDKKFERRDASNSNFFRNNDDSTGREVRAERETRNYTPNREFKPRREGSDNRRSYNPNFTSDNRVRRSHNDGDNNNSFRPRRENNGEFTPRNNFDRNRNSEGGFRPRRENDGEFKPRNNFDRNRNSEGGFRPRRENDGEFKPRNNFDRNRNSEGGFRPRRENDGEFKPRNNFDRNRNSEGGFRPRRENDGEFKPRNNFDRNRNSEGGFRPRRENDGEFKPRNNFKTSRTYGNTEGEFRPRRENNGEFKPRNNFDRNYSEGNSFRHKNDDFKSYDNSSFAAKSEENTQPEPLLNREIRLNRYISMSGICSRREADSIITEGLISVNDVVVTELGTKIKMTDEVKYNGEVIRGEKKVYIVMNKPKGFITTVEDIHAERTVIDLLKGKVNERVYPVGRLDKNTMGVLLLTNDGDLTKTLTHPSYNRKKIYQVFLDKNITEQDMERIAQGVELEDGIAYADEISVLGGNHKEVGIEIHNGRNRIVRRMFEHFGYKIMKLDRVYFGGITKKGLQRGFWRYLTPKEIQQLHKSK